MGWNRPGVVPERHDVEVFWPLVTGKKRAPREGEKEGRAFEAGSIRPGVKWREGFQIPNWVGPQRFCIAR